MKKIIPALFVIIAAVLAIIFFSGKTISKKSVDKVPSLVTADSQEKKTVPEEHNVTIVEENTPTSFLTLKNDETLLSSMGIDLNSDNLDDEILVVKRVSNPHLIIVIGIYNPGSKKYVRVSEIQTELTQLRSFSYNGLDVTGDHRMSLVYQGFTENGLSVLQIFLCGGTADNFSMRKIGDFKSDGTIFIQQYNRTDTYDLSQSSGKSFPVWVYSSDSSAGESSLGQIQTEYDWSPERQQYVQIRQIKVTGRNLAAKELAKIQDGTVETFAHYLNGLWYRISDESQKILYIFFDYEQSEVVFIDGDIQEVYSWISSSLYKNGIYLSTSNISIENLGRRFSVTLTDIDQVQIRAYDDVRMHIGADNQWDGMYKKLNNKEMFSVQEKDRASVKEIAVVLEKVPGWYTSDGTQFYFNGGSYSIATDNFTENGVFALSTGGGTAFIQFNSKDAVRYAGSSYSISFKEVPRIIRLKNGKTQTVYDTDKTSLILKPIVILASTVNEVSGKIIMLNAQID